MYWFGVHSTNRLSSGLGGRPEPQSIRASVSSGTKSTKQLWLDLRAPTKPTFCWLPLSRRGGRASSAKASPICRMSSSGPRSAMGFMAVGSPAGAAPSVPPRARPVDPPTSGGYVLHAISSCRTLLLYLVTSGGAGRTVWIAVSSACVRNRRTTPTYTNAALWLRDTGL